jgi:thiol:disulfide interchange protein DsbA
MVASAILMSSFSFADNYINTEAVKEEVEQNITGKIVVQQFFWHKCVHCYKLEGAVDKWDETKPDFIEFEKIPVIWSAKNKEEAKYYNYAKTLNKIGKMSNKELNELNDGLFKITFEEEKDFNAETVYPLFKKYGIESKESFEKEINSFAASAENLKSSNLTDKYGIKGVPMFVVNGKYIIGFQTLKTGEVTPENLFKTIEAIAKEELNKKK